MTMTANPETTSTAPPAPSAHDDKSTQTASFLVADFGSVYTRVVLVDVVEGVYRLVARGQTQTTRGYPFNDVGVGVQRICTIYIKPQGAHCSMTMTTSSHLKIATVVALIISSPPLAQGAPFVLFGLASCPMLALRVPIVQLRDLCRTCGEFSH
jgi:hypothetical protein